MPDVKEVPNHFVPTSTGPRWRGKIKCEYCSVDGWPYPNNAFMPSHWTLKHGLNCAKRPQPTLFP